MSQNFELPTESEFVNAAGQNQFLFISDGTHFGLYFNDGLETIGVKQQDPNFLWTPETDY